MRIFVLEFVTSVGGVQTVYKNILPELSRNHTIYFLDPYQSAFSDSLSETRNIKVLSMPIRSRSALGWNRGFADKIAVLFKYGYEYFRYLIKLISLTKHNKIDVLYVSGKKELLFAYLLKIFTGKPYIYHSHGFAKASDIGFLHKITISGADKIVCISAATMHILEEKHINKDKMSVVYNGVDIDKISSFLQTDMSHGDGFSVLFAGAIQPTKGVHTLINAVNRIALEEGGISLDVFGEVTNEVHRSYFEELSKIASDSKGAISLNGYTKDILSEISKCDLLVLPSENEGLGMVLLEAMCLKKPVVGSNVGGIPEIIDDGKTGLLFENKNADDLYEKIKYLKNNRDIAEKMGLLGRARAEELFSLKKQIDSIDGIINSIR